MNIYKGSPYLIDAKTAHKEGIITYNNDGVVIIKDKNLYELIGKNEIIIPLHNQYPAILATFIDLNKAISRLANSPLMENGKTLRQTFDEEFSNYRNLVIETQKKGGWEPDYGTYFYDTRTNNLYLIAPEYWHRMALVTSPSKLLTDPKNTLSWQEIRSRLDSAVIGVAGASVGGNILEGVAREVRPRNMKLADPDYWEVNNLSRAERISLRYLVADKASKKDYKNPFELVRNNKAESVAYEQHLIDPYANIYVYSEGITGSNMEQFLLGNEKEEPKLDLLIEEVDKISIKYELRELCRKHKIPVMMISDFGHRVQIQLQDYKTNDSEIGYNVSDNQISSTLQKALTTGNREDLFKFVRELCGEDFAVDEFLSWVKGEGEQPTSSLPQSGATAMCSGGMGGKIAAMYILGYSIPKRIIFDLKNLEVIVNR